MEEFFIDEGVLRLYTGDATEINIPDTVRSIAPDSFPVESEIIHIPASVVDIREQAFQDIGKLSSIIVDEKNPAYSSSDGILYNKNKDILIFCPSMKTGGVVIYNGTKIIAKRAFFCYRGKEELIIPDSVTTICNGAFGGSDFSKITMGKNVLTIGKNAFTSAEIESLYLSEKIEKIHPMAFGSNYQLAHIYLKKNNRYYCSVNNVLYNKRKTEIIICGRNKRGPFFIPNSVKRIGYAAFEGCRAREIVIPDSVTCIYDAAFALCNIRKMVIPNSVKIIGENAFSGCINIKNIHIPESVISIGDNAFYFCLRLERISVSSKNKDYCVYDGVLYNKEKSRLIFCMKGKKRLKIANGIKHINVETMDFPCSLTELFIPESVECIDDYSFAVCVKLESITVSKRNKKYCSYDGVLYSKDKKSLLLCPPKKTGLIYLPAQVTEIQPEVFNECDKIAGIVVPDENTKFFSDTEGVLYNKEKTEIIFCPRSKKGTYKIPDGVTRINISAFRECKELEYLSIPDTVEKTESRIFLGCNNLKIICSLQLLEKNIKQSREKDGRGLDGEFTADLLT